MKGKESQTFPNPEVEAVFTSYPAKVQPQMKYLRRLIYEVAAASDRIGELEETLKWGEPSYLTSKTKSGSTLRIDWKEKDPEHYAIFFICNTNLVETFKDRFFADTFQFSGNRAILFGINDSVPENELKLCIALALTYQLNKKLSIRERWQMAEDIVNKK